MAPRTTTIEDSVRTVTALSLAALVAGSLLVPADGAPVTEEEAPWWHNPCSYTRIRHSRGVPPLVKNQLKTISNNFNHLISRDINQYCSKIKNVHSKQFKKPDWLPSKKFFQSLSDTVSVLPEFHYQIQVHAATLHKLSNMRIESSVGSFDEDKRNDILNITAQNMKTLLCEVETALKIYKLDKKDLVPSNFVTDLQIPPLSNFTTGVFRDCSLLKEYGSFLKKSYKKLGGRGGRKNAKARKAHKNKKRTSRRKS